ncbi:WUSCHEL-related homeobox 4-like [Cryptomeria japonica]|uniref:WUSCHEL-related homeobox 4-like n=1 Tax=Cryptomeria japonica TaxID=3369 RepID=UPI0027DA17C6|nr:WUSCHEL-related homeobox 4-like [Cryptomeria japonica]
MERRSSQDSRLVRSASVIESASVRSVCSKWKATEKQQRILDSLFMNGMRNPSVDQINRITAELQRHGPVEGNNIYYWFQNNSRRERRKKEQPAESSSKWTSVLKARNWTSLFRSKKSSDMISVREEEYNNMQDEEEVDSVGRRNSSVDPSDIRTLELFPLQPDK